MAYHEWRLVLISLSVAEPYARQISVPRLIPSPVRAASKRVGVDFAPSRPQHCWPSQRCIAQMEEGGACLCFPIVIDRSCVGLASGPTVIAGVLRNTSEHIGVNCSPA